MNIKRFDLTQRFNSRYYGLGGGSAREIKGIDQYDKLIFGATILEVEYERTSKTTWATKYFEIDMDVNGFYQIEDREQLYIYEVKDGDVEITAIYNENDRAKMFEKIKNVLGITVVEVTEDNAEIIATELENTYSLKMTTFSYDVLDDIKSIEGRKYDPANKEWIITKEQKESLLNLNYKVFFK